jgi:hypothetical protein
MEMIDIKQLLAPATHILTAEERAAAVQYAEGLFEGRVGEIKVSITKSLGEVDSIQTRTHVQFFYLDYFNSEAVGEDREALGLQAKVSFEEWTQQLYDIDSITKNIEANDRKAIARRSNLWRKQRLIDLLNNDAAQDGDFEPFAYVEVNFYPEALLQRLEGLVAYKNFYKHLLIVSSEVSTALRKAQGALLQVHLHRVEGFLRDAYGASQALAQQLNREILSKEELDWKRRVEALLPDVILLQQEEDAEEALQAVKEFAVQATEVQQSLNPAIDKQTLAALDAAHWNAVQLKDFFEAVLAHWGLLSSEQAIWEDIDVRSGMAKDALFQVVIRPTKSNLAVSSSKRVVFVPEDFDRSIAALYPAGGLPVAAHELTHVLQAFADHEVGKVIPLATIKGYRYRIGREAGGVYQESLLQERYFGRLRPINRHYLKAMTAKLEEKSQLAVIRTFYDSYLQANPQAENAAAVAVDRALRLYRRNGYYVTPINILEQADLLAQLRQITPRQATLFALAGSSFSPQDALLLKEVGLLTIPEHLAFEPAQDVIEVYRKKALQPPINEYNERKYEVKP